MTESCLEAVELTRVNVLRNPAPTVATQAFQWHYGDHTRLHKRHLVQYQRHDGTDPQKHDPTCDVRA
jgi:hypothetical protein